MDSTPEFPHVALSPGEISPDIDSTGSQDQPAAEVQDKSGEVAEETPASTTVQGSTEEGTSVEQSAGADIGVPETAQESWDKGALQHEQTLRRELVDTAGKIPEGQEDLPPPPEESTERSEQKRDEQTTPVSMEIFDQVEKGRLDQDDSVMQMAAVTSEQENKDVASSQGQGADTTQDDKAKETLSEVERQFSSDQGMVIPEEMDSTDGNHKLNESVQVENTESSEARKAGEEATKEPSIEVSEDQASDKPEDVTITETETGIKTLETDKKTDGEGQGSEELISTEGNLDNASQKEPEGSTGNIVADLICKGLISESSQQQTTVDQVQDKADSDEKNVDSIDAEVTNDATVAVADGGENDSQGPEEEQEPELMDTQILESEDGNTCDSVPDLGTKDSDGNVCKVPKIYDECSMESFVSAKSSEFDYRDSLQGSPLPVKRVRELIDESPRASPKRSRTSTPTVHSDDDLGHFPAENVFEYQWPQDNPGEWYFVQEQISEFLGVKSFKRKYPSLERRVMDIKEKEFLRERGVVTEEQVTLGLTALRGDEVYDLMMKDYPNRYTEYARVIQEKQRQNISNQHKGYEAPTMDASKIKEYIKKAAKQAAEFNALLMREKREERQYYFDLQTMQLHMPQAKMKKLSKEDTKIGAYPVAVIPGQYQDYCRHYTADELNYLPLNTALYGPMAIRRKTDYAPEVEEDEGEDDLDIMAELTKNDDDTDKKDKNKSKLSSTQPQNDQQQRQQQEQRLQQLLNQPPQNQQQKQQSQRQQPRQQQQPVQQQQQQEQPQPPPASSTPATSQSPSRPTILRPRAGPIVVQPGPESGGSGDSDVRLPGPEALQQSMEAVVPTPPKPYQPKIKPTAICGLCLKDRRSNTKGVPEDLVHCSQCDNSGHPSCLDMNDELVATIKTYPWQCMECKTCSHCGDPTHEDKMMFCDKCDRGYHTFCVGLTDIPSGNWLCPTCSAGGLPPPVLPPPPSNLSLSLAGGSTPIQLPPGAMPLPQQMPQRPPLQQPPLPPQQQGAPPQQQGIPPQQQMVPPQQQGVPPQQQGVPPPQQGIPPQQHRVPAMPPQQQGMPPQLQGMPPQLQGMPPHPGLPFPQQGLLPQQQVLPPQQQGLLPQQQGLPPQQQGLPSQQQGLPPHQQNIPAQMPGLPSQPQGPPATPEQPALGAKRKNSKR